MRCCLLFGLLLTGFIRPLVFRTVAQAPVTTTLAGDVRDATTGKPLPFANVYLNSTTRGTTTNQNGQFTLTNVPLGTVEVVASFLGYQTVRQRLRLDDVNRRTVRFRLKPDGRALAGVTVRAKSKDRTWQRQFRRFKDQLLGEPFGGQCLITNSYALTFSEEKGHLTATATEPLIIENQALGYRLYYDLQHFDGSYQRVYYAGTSRFEELPATDERQAARFGRNRMRAYRGSLRHLMASLVAGTFEREHFLVYQEDITQPIATDGTVTYLASSIGKTKRLRPFRADSLIQAGKLAFERRLVSSLPIVVFNTQKISIFSPYRDARYEYSELWLPNEQMQFTTDGWITAPNGMEVKGSLADDRLSTLLPADWTPAPAGPDDAADAPMVAQGKLMPPDARSAQIQDAFADQFRLLAPALYVHTDKALYATGDRLWLSAYLLDAATHQRPVGETTMQVDLLTPAGRLVQHQWLDVKDGRAVGDFRLSDSLASGTYRLRAYTDEDAGQRQPAFERSVAVSNLLRTQPAPAAVPAPDTLDLQVLPEGGRWIVGMPARLGVKVVGRDGRGRMTSGRIVDEAGREVGRFATNALGMGRIELTPQPGRMYSAEVMEGQATGSAGRLIAKRPLLTPETTGLTLSADVVSDTNRLTIRVAQAGGPIADSVYLLIQQRGQIVRQQKLLIENGVAQFSLPVATLPSGLHQITLYDAAGGPQTERLVFIPDRLPALGVVMTTHQPHYQPREPVNLNIGLTDDGQPAVAALSVSVADADLVPDDTAEASLRTHVLLTGELRGRVEQPDVYGKDTSPATRRALDDLLLTQGWRRMTTQKPAGSTNGWTLSGRAEDRRGRPLVGEPVTLQLETNGLQFLRSLTTNQRGEFRLDGLRLTDTVRVRATTPKVNGSIIRFDAPGQSFQTTQLLTSNQSALAHWADAALSRQAAWPALYRDSTARQLAEVVVRAYKPTPKRPAEVERASLHGSADATVIVEGNDSFSYAGGIGDMIRRLPGVRPAGNSFRIGGPISLGSSESGGDNTPLYLIDGVYADEPIALDVDPRTVSRIELLKYAGTAGIYGARAAAGVIAIYTRKRKADVVTASGGTAVIVSGLVTPREFYVPRHDRPGHDSSTEATGQPTARVDRRDVLYWKPLAQTDANGQTGLRFPLSDVVKILRVTVQGITTEGRAVSATRLIRVR